MFKIQPRSKNILNELNREPRWRKDNLPGVFVEVPAMTVKCWQQHKHTLGPPGSYRQDFSSIIIIETAIQIQMHKAKARRLSMIFLRNDWKGYNYIHIRLGIDLIVTNSPYLAFSLISNIFYFDRTLPNQCLINIPGHIIKYSLTRSLHNLTCWAHHLLLEFSWNETPLSQELANLPGCRFTDFLAAPG